MHKLIGLKFLADILKLILKAISAGLVTGQSSVFVDCNEPIADLDKTDRLNGFGVQNMHSENDGNLKIYRNFQQ